MRTKGKRTAKRPRLLELLTLQRANIISYDEQTELSDNIGRIISWRLSNLGQPSRHWKDLHQECWLATWKWITGKHPLEGTSVSAVVVLIVDGVVKRNHSDTSSNTWSCSLGACYELRKRVGTLPFTKDDITCLFEEVVHAND
jgi:hypothetical protein